ncbi:MAG: DUF2163 domain-containing protein [Sphingomonadaceae bacterium]
MSRVYFREELEANAHFWRVMRRDGVTLGFTTHDRDLWFDGIWHRCAPGMTPSSISLSGELEDESGDISGVLSHDSITHNDLASGRYDGAQMSLGLVNWETCEHTIIFSGFIRAVSVSDGLFSAEIESLKALLEHEPVPHTSPGCRADFCGKGCGLSEARFTRDALVTDYDQDAASVRVELAAPEDYIGGKLRWVDGHNTGLTSTVLDVLNDALVLDAPLPVDLEAGMRVTLCEGCDHTLASCVSRFDNGVNFRGEPHLPGNDLLARYPVSRS